MQRSLDKAGLAFLFAPDIHPVFRHFAPVRAKIGVPTVFNVLGPLVNPTRPALGFYRHRLRRPHGRDVRDRYPHRQTCIVVRGWDGLD